MLTKQKIVETAKKFMLMSLFKRRRQRVHDVTINNNVETFVSSSIVIIFSSKFDFQSNIINTSTFNRFNKRRKRKIVDDEFANFKRRRRNFQRQQKKKQKFEIEKTKMLSLMKRMIDNMSVSIDVAFLVVFSSTSIFSTFIKELKLLMNQMKKFKIEIINLTTQNKKMIQKVNFMMFLMNMNN